MTSLLIIASVIAVIVAWVWFKFYQARGKIEHLLKTNAELEQHSQQQAVEINTKNTEIKYAQIKQKNTDKASRSKLSTIDQQLHHHNWFRAEGSSNGLSGVSQNLSKPSGHDGNETSDSGS